MTAGRLVLNTLFLTLAPLSSGTQADPGIEQLFRAGNELYSQGDFKSAIAQYHKIEERQFVNEALFFNLGNAYFKLGRLGYTILYYEKARRILPNDPELDHNLALACSQITDRVTAPPDSYLTDRINGLIGVLPIDLVTQLTLTFFLLGSSSLTLMLLWNSPRGRQLSLLLGLIFLFLFLLFGLLNGAQIYRQASLQEAIVLLEEVAVVSGPGEENSTLFAVHEGLKVRIRNQVEDWMQISLDNGWSGWVKSEALGRI